MVHSALGAPSRSCPFLGCSEETWGDGHHNDLAQKPRSPAAPPHLLLPEPSHRVTYGPSRHDGPQCHLQPLNTFRFLPCEALCDHQPESGAPPSSCSPGLPTSRHWASALQMPGCLPHRHMGPKRGGLVMVTSGAQGPAQGLAWHSWRDRTGEEAAPLTAL